MPRPRYINPWARYLPWLAGFVLVAGLVAFAVSQIGGTASPTAETIGTEPAQTFEERESVPLAAEAREVAAEFLTTAVPRKSLRRSWEITHPDLKRGYTLRKWLTGSIPVQYYPTGDLEVATFKVDRSYEDEATIEVALIPRKDSKVKPQIFFVGLKKLDGHWLVDYFAPRGSAAVPDTRD